jgi:hypothetical protein
MIMGHNPVAGWLVGTAAKWASRDAPDAAKLAMLKFLGSDAPVEAEGFKAIMDFAHKIIKGEKTLTAVTANVFKAGQQILPDHMVPKAADTHKLDKRIEELKKDPMQLQDSGGKIVHYGPEYGQSMAQTSSNAVNYLSSLKPHPQKDLPLDTESKPDAFKQHEYEAALKIAASPLSALQSLKNGTLTPADVQSFQTIYPALYAKTGQRLLEQMTNEIQAGTMIPYATRIGLSLFLGQPMDSTLSQAGIMGAQPQMPMPNAPQLPKGMGKPTQAGLGKLTQLGKVSMTADQGSLYRTLNQRH